VLHAFLTASILSPETIVEKGGLLLVAAIIFAESGLLIGFFLPGDSLLFITGFLTNTSTNLPVHVKYPLPVVVLALVVAAILGDQVGYLFGRRVGPSLFRRPDSKLFKQENVEKAQAFFDRHGPKTIVLARFVPIVRTFAPIVAGVGRMRYRQFVAYNLIGGTAWAAGVTTLGYFLGKISFIRHNIELAALAIVFVSLVPVLLEVKKHRAAARTSTPLV
jgi:membrane-associated protein